MPRNFKPRFDFEQVMPNEWERRRKVLEEYEPGVKPSDILYSPLTASMPARLKVEIVTEAVKRNIPTSWVVVEWLIVGRNMQEISDNWE